MANKHLQQFCPKLLTLIMSLFVSKEVDAGGYLPATASKVEMCIKAMCVGISVMAVSFVSVKVHNKKTSCSAEAN